MRTRHIPDWVHVGSAPWKPRDSMGYAVFNEKVWILGGWFDSWIPCPRDVWSSSDGLNWHLSLDVAPWKFSDFPIALSHADRLWVMGGWYNGRMPDGAPGNEVWSTFDGELWTSVCSSAGWSPRVGAAAVSFVGKMWVFGGVQNYFQGSVCDQKNDVWSSTDGKNWQMVLESAPWVPRAFHQVVVFQDKMWVLGGGNYLPKYKAFNDVWCSADGLEWTQVSTDCSWAPRLWFSALVYRDCLWVLGGWSKEPFHDWADAWYSPDGINWTSLDTPSIWSGRHAQAAWVFQDEIWLAGGHARPLSNEVWKLSLPKHEETGGYTKTSFKRSRA